MKPEKQTSSRNELEHGHSTLGKAAALGAVGLAAAAGFFPRGGEAPVSTPQPESFIDMAQESAQKPYDPATDELLIDGIRIKPGNPNRNSPSEAVWSNRDVKDFTAANPDEAASLEASTMVLPMNESGEYVVIGRDIDADGDNDAVAVSATK